MAETRKNEGFEQIGSDHPVRKLISRFRKISQESRAAQNTQNAPTPPNVPTNPPSQQTSPSLAAQITTRVTPADANDSSPTANPNDPSLSQHLQLPSNTTGGKTRDKLETISERIETQESQISQITSVHQSPPLHRPPRSSKWKWLKTGSTGPPESPPRGTIPTIKPSPPQQQRAPNPFDSNTTDEPEDGGERRLSIPMSLFIPRAARRDSAKISDDGSDEHVRLISLPFIDNSFLFRLLETIR